MRGLFGVKARICYADSKPGPMHRPPSNLVRSEEAAIRRRVECRGKPGPFLRLGAKMGRSCQPIGLRLHLTDALRPPARWCLQSMEPLPCPLGSALACAPSGVPAPQAPLEPPPRPA